MKLAVFMGCIAALVVSGVMGFVALVKAGNRQAERTEQTFKAECEAVNGRAVWNNRYWECLK